MVKYSPVGKWLPLFSLFKFLPLLCASQVSDAEISLLHKLDSIKNSASISRHFAGLYFTTTSEAVDFFLNKEESVREFMQRLETRFAAYFFRSADAFTRGTVIPSEWKAYFSGSAFSSLQYQLLGINAHINGDIWQALTTEFSFQEILENKKYYFDFQKGLAREYRNFYISSVNSNATTRMLHGVSLGLDRLYGKIMLAKWRKRQMQLAILYYTDKDRLLKKLGKLKRKMDHLNQLILTDL